MSSHVLVREAGPNLLLRAVYFVVFGLWFSGVWAAVAWILCVTIIGLPVGLWMLNRLPLVTTLQPHRADLLISADGRVLDSGTPQLPLLTRAVYFLLVGWWLSAAWMALAWALCATWIGIPFGFWMLNRVPALITLARS